MALVTQINNLTVRIATEIKSLRTLINGNASDLSALNTADKTSLVAALNELKTAFDGFTAGGVIDDDNTALTTTFSSQKITDDITSAIAALTNGAPGALDQLNELAAALGNDANFAATVTNSLSNRVRVDAVQGLTSPQREQARNNIDVFSRVEIGDVNTNFVTGFEAALV